jgi:hypothetical protein
MPIDVSCSPVWVYLHLTTLQFCTVLSSSLRFSTVGASLGEFRAVLWGLLQVWATGAANCRSSARLVQMDKMRSPSFWSACSLDLPDLPRRSRLLAKAGLIDAAGQRIDAAAHIPVTTGLTAPRALSNRQHRDDNNPAPGVKHSRPYFWPYFSHARPSTKSRSQNSLTYFADKLT